MHNIEFQRETLDEPTPGKFDRLLAAVTGAADTGDDDPSRVIESAEVGMTFHIEPGNSLLGYIDMRMTEIRRRVNTEQ